MIEWPFSASVIAGLAAEGDAERVAMIGRSFAGDCERYRRERDEAREDAANHARIAADANEAGLQFARERDRALDALERARTRAQTAAEQVEALRKEPGISPVFSTRLLEVEMHALYVAEQARSVLAEHRRGGS